MALLYSSINISQAQQQSNPDSYGLSAMGKLSWMEGTWTGNGWLDTRDDRQIFTQTETVTYKVKGTVMLFEGLGINQHDKSIKYESFSVVSYDVYGRKYLMRTFKSDGNYVDAKITVEDDGTLIWGFQHQDMPEVRYTIKLVDNLWVEIAEFSLGGTNWTKFYEKKLKKS